MIDEGYVSARAHPTESLTILNYTAACQYEHVWNDVTRQCRGLIVHDGWDDVVARPWPKFYNYGEHEADALDLDAKVEVTDKLDGSLGILYPVREGQWAVATRGSFDSEQARWASEVWRDSYSHIEPERGWTFLFEIVYPGNRIVVDYGDLDDLVLLGSVSVETGETRGPLEAAWPGRRAETFETDTLRDALELPPRENAEGLVVRYVDSGLMLKLKQDDYVELHRIVTCLNERTVWERMGAGETKEQICEGLPDEFQEWVEDVALTLNFRADHVYYTAREAHADIMAGVSLSGNRDWSRKDYALEAQEPQYADVRPYLFMLLDGRDPRPAIWRSIKPEAS